MARRQAQRRKTRQVRKFSMPAIPVKRLFAMLLALVVVAFSYHFSAELLDQPISSISIEGPFQRVSALQIEEAISAELDSGFFSANLSLIQNRITALQWIDSANVARRWPGMLEISVAEQIPAAIWGERGLLNTRGDLFVSVARHVPVELPRLSGPEGTSSVVAQRYLDMREKLIPFGLELRQVTLDTRGAWTWKLSSGIDVRLGRRDVDTRTELFLAAAATIVSSRETEIDYVDMRYGNGFTIGWKGGSHEPVRKTDSIAVGVVAGLNGE